MAGTGCVVGRLSTLCFRWCGMCLSSFTISSTDPSAGWNRNWNGNSNRWGGPRRGGTPKSRSGAGTPLRGAGVDSPQRGNSTPRGSGSSRGRGRGRGRGKGRGGGGVRWEFDNGGDVFTSSRRPHFGVGVDAGAQARTRTKIGKDASLSELLYSERPLLRPVKFVRATLTPFLFQNSEEVFGPALDVAGEKNLVILARWLI